jgi:organic radical activating enzyme
MVERSEKPETHLDAMMRQYEGGGLEERFLRAKKIFLFEKLGRLQDEINRKKLSPDIGFLLMILYVFDFILRDVGEQYSEQILESLRFTGWPLDHFKPLLKRESMGDWIRLGVSLNYRELDEATQSRTTDMVLRLWHEFGLDRDYYRDVERIIEEKKEQYSRISSPPDLERKKIVERLAEKNAKRRKIRLLNIGIVPTELCPNSCRFCLAAWKSSVEERISRPISDEDFKKIADQVVDFANERSIIITITGGEPLLELDRVLYIIGRANTRVDLSTSGFWGADKKQAADILAKIDRAVKNNKNRSFRFYLQLSLDFFHQEVRLVDGRLKENVPLNNIVNIIELCQKRFKRIQICPLTKFTIYDDPLLHLMDELKRRGLDVKLTDRKFNPDLKVPVMVGGRWEMKPALLSAKLYVGEGKPLLISYSAVERIGKASALEKFEFPTFESRVEKFLEGKSKEKFPLIGLEVSDDGNVYPGAHSLYSWSLGNLLETSLEDICRMAEYDPLFITLAEDPYKIVEFSKEVDSNIVEKVKGESSPVAAVFKILEAPEMRLHITKRLIQENEAYSEIKSDIGIS